MCLPGPAGYTSEMPSYVWAHMSVVDPDLELGGGLVLSGLPCLLFLIL